MRSIWTAAVALMALCLPLTGHAQEGFIQQQVNQSDVTKNPALDHVRVDQRPGAQLPMSAVFKDETGKQITFGSLFTGRPIVLMPIFYRCTGVCNLELQGVLNALVQSPKLLPGRDLDVVAVGINPQEGPDLAKGKKQSTLEEYGKPQSAKGWHFLTGDMQNIRLVTNAMGFDFSYDAGKNVVNHPSGIMVLTPKGMVSAYMLSGMFQPTEFQEDVSRAAAAVIAPKSDEIFFGCICIDPITGKRSLVITNVLRLLGILTVVSILGAMVFMSTRNRKLHSASA